MRTPFRPEPSRAPPTSSDRQFAPVSASTAEAPRSHTQAVPARQNRRDRDHSSATPDLAASWAPGGGASHLLSGGSSGTSGSRQPGGRTTPVPIPCAPSANNPHSKSFVPPHLLANASRSPESMARSYSKRRPPSWL